MERKKLQETTPEMRRNDSGTAWLAVFAVAIVTTIIRIHLLKRCYRWNETEGEYAYMGQLMLRGIPPYVVMADTDLKLPGVCACYALIMAVFGQTTAGIHTGLIVVNLATIVLIYLFGTRLFGRGGGVAAAITFAILSVGRGFLGMTANAEHFVVLPAVAGLFLLVDAVQNNKLTRLIWSGAAAWIGSHRQAARSPVCNLRCVLPDLDRTG